ncbi:MAG: hypothetical protein IKM60_02470 [Clostridia bacterium]|nr:hypothetical protein [Clostridia bacterium]
MENVGELLLKKGKWMCGLSKKLFICAAIGLALLLIVWMGCAMQDASEYFPEYLVFEGPYAFVNVIVFLAYLGVLAGFGALPCYLYGLHFMGLGQIAKNTEK